MRCSWCVVCLAALVVACGGTASKRAAEEPVVARDTVASGDNKAGRVSRGEPGALPAATSAKEAPAEPRGRFTPSGEPTVVEAFLGPDASWRFLESQITALRAEASALRRDIFVEFHEDFFQATVRGGKRTIWRLPKGLRLNPGGRRILLRGDHTCEVSGNTAVCRK